MPKQSDPKIDLQNIPGTKWMRNEAKSYPPEQVRREFEAAVSAVKALARRMGEGWTGRVWYNMGWHNEAISPCGRVDITRRVHMGKPSYGACIRAPGESIIGGAFHESASNPESAIRKVERLARNAARHYESMTDPPICRAKSAGRP